jgi:hypothetical protein
MTGPGFGDEFELTRVREERRLYALEGVGTLRLPGMRLRHATASTCDGTWRFTRRSVWQRSLRATDALGTEVGTFRPREIRRGGTVYWRGREYRVRPHRMLRERYALALAQTDRERDRGRALRCASETPIRLPSKLRELCRHRRIAPPFPARHYRASFSSRRDKGRPAARAVAESRAGARRRRCARC